MHISECGFAIAETEYFDEPVSPVHSLWCRVLRLAIEDLDHSTTSDACSFRWFLSENFEIGSFLWICFHLDLSPDFIIRRLAPDLLRHLRNDKLSNK